MKLTKRILCFALVLTLIFALCACGKDAEKEKIVTPDGSSVPTDNSVQQPTIDDWASNLEGDNMFNDAELDWG